MYMYAVATLANSKALEDLKLFLFSLQLWNENMLPNLYIYSDTCVSHFLETQKLYKGKIFIKNVLDKYSSYTRNEMEKMPGENYENRWVDLMCEKMNLIEWVHENEKSVLFCDADICFLGALPVVEDNISVGLSRHYIRSSDEAKFGTYNGGFIYSNSKDMLQEWRTATHKSRYYEQAALEVLSNSYTVYEFPVQNNYGWWRLLQGNESVEILKNTWSIRRSNDSSGIAVCGKQLLSVHTHWKTNDSATQYFNSFVLNFLEKLKSVEKTKQLLNFLKKI